jgi:DNA-binding transcriptional regulator YhcF (GntR family)
MSKANNNINDQNVKKIYIPNKVKVKMVLEDRKLSSGAKLVLYNLMSRLHKKKYCWPSQERIAKDIGLSSRQVRNHLEELKRRNLLNWQKGGKTYKGTQEEYATRSNKYDLSPVLSIRVVTIKPKKQKEDMNEEV